jgi:hypothetical protein
VTDGQAVVSPLAFSIVISEFPGNKYYNIHCWSVNYATLTFSQWGTAVAFRPSLENPVPETASFKTSPDTRNDRGVDDVLFESLFQDELLTSRRIWQLSAGSEG